MNAIFIKAQSFWFKSARNVCLAVLGLAVCSQLIIPVSPVPWTLQVFGLIVMSFIMSPSSAFLSVLLWIVLGIVGLPLFSGYSSGPKIIFGATGGYFWGFLFAAPIVSYFKLFSRSFVGKLLCEIFFRKKDVPISNRFC